MGLIKTAIMTGGGIYAINKIAKASEHRHENHQQSSNSRGQYDGYAPRQGDYNQQAYSTPPAYRDASQTRDPRSADSLYSPPSEYGRQTGDQKQLAGSSSQYYQQREAGYIVPENERFEERREKSPVPALMKMAQDVMGKK